VPEVRRTLAELQPGERGRVVEVGGDRDTARRLMDLGLVRGTALEVIRRAPLGDPLEVRVRGFMLTLRSAEAEHITVDE
jgi:ferrous iron transport protein A